MDAMSNGMAARGLLMFLGLGVGLSAAVAGDVVIRERGDGSVVITDAPSSGADPNRASPTEDRSGTSSGTSLPATSPKPTTNQGSSAPVMQRDYALNIREPEPDAVVWADSARLRVTVVAEPSLAEDHRLRVSLGDHASATVSGAGIVELHPVHRGSYSLQAEVINADGQVLTRTPPRTIHVKQHSRLHPGAAD